MQGKESGSGLLDVYGGKDATVARFSVPVNPLPEWFRRQDWGSFNRANHGGHNMSAIGSLSGISSAIPMRQPSAIANSTAVNAVKVNTGADMDGKTGNDHDSDDRVSTAAASTRQTSIDVIA